MTKIALRTVASLLVVLGLYQLSTVMVSAQSQAGNSPTGQTTANKSALTISPAIVEQVLKPGVKTEYTLRLANMTDFPLPISGTVKSFEPLEEISDSRKRALYDASRWFTLSEPDFILQGKQTRTIKVTIQPPAAAEPGGHYATVYFQPLLPAGVLTPSTAYLSARVGSLAFLIIPGDVDEKLQVSSFSVPKVHQTGPLAIQATLKNDGGIHQSPNSKVTIKDWRGKKVTEISTNFGIILPGSSKNYTASWDSPPLFGRFSATYEATFGADNKQLTSDTVHIWVIPWVLLLVIGVPLLLAGFMLFRTRGRWKRAWRILRGKDLE